MHINSVFRCSAIVLGLLFLSSCAGTQTIVSSPTVNLSSVTLARASFAQQTFHLGFNVDNPNPFPLPVKAVEYRVLIDQEKFAGGVTQGSFTVPARGQDVFTISVDLDILSAAAAIANLLQNGMPDQANYELQGNLTVDIPFVKPVPFSATGVVPIRGSLR